MENLEHNEIVLMNDIINKISYSLIQTMFNDAKNNRFETLYHVKGHLGVEFNEFLGKSDKIDLFIEYLNRLVIIFNSEINNTSVYRKTDRQFVIMLNYRHTEAFKNLNRWITNTDNNKHSKFGLKFINLLPVKQILRKLMGKPFYDVKNFSNFLATSGDLSFFKYFLDDIRTTIAHELKHMFDDIISNGQFVKDADSLDYYNNSENKNDRKKQYLNLRHEIDARIQQGLRGSERFIDKSNSFDEYLNEFIKTYQVDDYNQLTDDNKNYVLRIVNNYYENHKNNGIKTNNRYRINENMDEENKINTIYSGISIICEDLGVEVPTIHLLTDKEFTYENKSFAAYSPSNQEIYCVIEGRNTADCLRSIAHELMHHKQNLEGRLTTDAGVDGDTFENEANSYAGIIMRRLGRELPNIFESVNNNIGKRITKSSILQENILKNKNIFIEKILGRII